MRASVGDLAAAANFFLCFQFCHTDDLLVLVAECFFLLRITTYYEPEVFFSSTAKLKKFSFPWKRILCRNFDFSDNSFVLGFSHVRFVRVFDLSRSRAKESELEARNVSVRILVEKSETFPEMLLLSDILSRWMQNLLIVVFLQQFPATVTPIIFLDNQGIFVTFFLLRNNPFPILGKRIGSDFRNIKKHENKLRKVQGCQIF